MEQFINQTDDGNEKAIRRGARVPDGAVNMAWVKAPRLTPDKNVVIVDTSRTVEENIVDDNFKCKIMYANSLGILEDEFGNQVIQDEYPAVADVFSIDEDFITTPGSEYKAEHILGYLHVSRYFHIDFPGLTLGTIPQTYRDDTLRVVDERGKEYTNDRGEPRYRIQITPANVNVVSSSENAAYRVFAFIDTDSNENLYLTYNKVEVNADGQIVNQNINHREILNPQPYFLYQPEESDVVDPVNRNKKWYSTKPTTLKEQVLNKPHSDVDGFKVYVPKKAIGDPRQFQLFRWRMACDFVDKYRIDPSRDSSVIRAGVVTVGSVTNVSPYAFYNMERSQYNASQVRFVNPLKEELIDPPDKNTSAYWTVDLLTVSNEDLAKFDILLFAPLALSFDFRSIITKIKYFTETLGRTFFIETHNYVQISNFGFTLSRPVGGTGPTVINSGPGTHATGTTIRPASGALSDPLFDGDAQLGGWEMNDGTPDELVSISPFKNGAYSAPGYHQYISPTAYPKDYKSILISTRADGAAVPAFMKKTTSGGGNILISTIGIGHAPNVLYSDADGRYLYPNRASRIHSTPKYQELINGYNVEGVMKLFYNVCLLAVKNAILDSSDEQTFSTSWTAYSPWKASWVIDGEVLSDSERDLNDFVFMPKDPTILEPVWQRKLSNKTAKQLIDEQLTQKDLQRVAGATRYYRMELSNDNVEGPITIDDNIKPYAYTEEYSPPFEVPIELGPHVIREEQVQGEYDSDSYMHKSYPAKPFKAQVQTNYDQTSESLVTQTVTVTCTGSATEVIKTVTPVVTANTELCWTEHGSKVIFNSGVPFEFGAPHAHGIATWQQSNYYTNNWGPGNRIWNHFGIFGKFSTGSRGEVVAFIQDAMNRFMWWGFFNGGIGGGLAVDGYYGSKTATVIRNFQITFGARYVDGVVDAETLSIIGAQILRLGNLVGRINPNDHTRFFEWPKHYMYNRNISDKNQHNKHLKRSWMSGGPSIIWELYGVTFNQQYNIHGISLTPAVDGATRNLMWRSIDIRSLGHYTNLRPFLSNYNSQWGKAIYMPHRPSDGQKFYIPIGPYKGDTIIVGIGQDRGSGFGTSRVLGVRDLVAHAKTQTGGQTITQERAYNFTVTKTFNVKTGKVVTIKLTPPYTGKGKLTNIKWKTAVSNNPEVRVTITAKGTLTAEHNEVVINNTDNYTKGPIMPISGGVYSINPNVKTPPIIESGWISKADGIKLLSTSDGKPTGFPAMPTTIGANESQRHYATLTINTFDIDPSVRVGFYDKAQKEFIWDVNGEPAMSYIEYVRRGPQNIYVGAISTYEEELDTPIPPVTDSPPIPFKWAMPVYGVCSKSGSRIGIEPLPNGLSYSDLWSIPIRTGNFNKLYSLRPVSEGPLTGWQRDYQGTQIRAFYGVAEAKNGGWSTIYGRPNVDVVGETPDIVDDSVIQVRQAPILMVQEPTAIPSNADPVRPVFTVEIRDSIASDWRTLRKDEILDWNASEGTIFLRSPLPSSDPNLVRVNYTTPRKIYNLKTYGGQKINLNPYPGHSRDLIGRPIYVYIVPEYCRDAFGRTIPDSVEDRTVRFTLSPDIFNSLDPDYNPLAIQLGVIYITSALDINDMIVLDTRRRGGGVMDSLDKADVINSIEEAVGYWDIGHGAGIAYQKGGFVIVRLPKELIDQFPDQSEIEAVIRRNLTAGTAFKLQDLNGHDWGELSNA